MRRTDPLRILIIDDLGDFVEAMSMYLQFRGYHVATAVDARAGILQASAFQPEAVLLDIGLPGVDGYHAAKLIRERVETPLILIAVTGWARAADKQQAFEAGFDHHLTKPVVLSDLEELLNQLKTVRGIAGGDLKRQQGAYC